MAPLCNTLSDGYIAKLHKEKEVSQRVIRIVELSFLFSYFGHHLTKACK